MPPRRAARGRRAMEAALRRSVEPAALRGGRRQLRLQGEAAGGHFSNQSKPTRFFRGHPFRWLPASDLESRTAADPADPVTACSLLRPVQSPASNIPNIAAGRAFDFLCARLLIDPTRLI